jgi:hypothetical protein
MKLIRHSSSKHPISSSLDSDASGVQEKVLREDERDRNTHTHTHTHTDLGFARDLHWYQMWMNEPSLTVSIERHTGKESG